MSFTAKLAGGIAARRRAKKAQKEYKKAMQKEIEKNNDWFNQRYNEDATQRADAQAVITQTMDAIKQRNRQAAGTQAVMGGTDESVAAEKAANNEALAQTMSNVAVNADARKDQIEQQYRERDESLNDTLNTNNYKEGLQQAQNIQDVTASMASDLSKMKFGKW